MALKSAQPDADKVDVEEVLDYVDKTLDRVKVLYEQYFLGMQKQPPAQLHTDVERRLRDLQQLNIRNTGLRYRFATLQQKFGSYNSYWRRTLRQIENGTYIRNLAKIGRQAALTGEEIPDEILAAMPKRMREQVKRDREQALAIRRRRDGLDGAVDVDMDLGDAAVISDAPARTPTPMSRDGAHLLGGDDDDFDIEAFFASVTDEKPAAGAPRASIPGPFSDDDTQPNAPAYEEPAPTKGTMPLARVAVAAAMPARRAPGGVPSANAGAGASPGGASPGGASPGGASPGGASPPAGASSPSGAAAPAMSGPSASGSPSSGPSTARWGAPPTGAPSTTGAAAAGSPGLPGVGAPSRAAGLPGMRPAHSRGTGASAVPPVVEDELTSVHGGRPTPVEDAPTGVTTPRPTAAPASRAKQEVPLAYQETQALPAMPGAYGPPRTQALPRVSPATPAAAESPRTQAVPVVPPPRPSVPPPVPRGATPPPVPRAASQPGAAEARPSTQAVPRVPDARPSTQAMPGMPERPSMPAMPGMPERPSMPAMPGSPERPSTPAMPRAPEPRPSTQAMPGVPSPRPQPSATGGQPTPWPPASGAQPSARPQPSATGGQPTPWPPASGAAAGSTSGPGAPTPQRTTAIPVVPMPARPGATNAPSQQSRPNPIAPGSSTGRVAIPVQSMQGPFPRTSAPEKPAPRPDAPPMRPPPGMNDADVNALYAKYVKAKEMVGEEAGPGAYSKLMKTINAQAPKIMEQYKAKGVEFSVVVKDNQVIIKAKPKT